MKLRAIDYLQCAALTIAALCILSSANVSAQVGDVVCTKLTTGPAYTCRASTLYTWVVPTTRADGTPLALNELTQYQIVAVRAAAASTIPDANTDSCGQCWNVPISNGDAITLQREIRIPKADILDDGKADTVHAIRVQDTAGKWSVWSDLVAVELVFPPAFVDSLRVAPGKMQLIDVTIVIS